MNDPHGASPPRTRDAEATRRKLLDAGLELLRRDSVGHALNQVKAAKVARAAGLTQGAFFHHWPTQADYLEDLFDHALATDRFEWTSRTAAGWIDELDRGGDLEELTDRISSALVAGLGDDVSFQVQAALWGRADVDDVVAERLRRLYHESDRRFGELFRRTLESRGLRAKPGHDYEEMALIANAILEGLVLRRRIDPDLVRPELLGQLMLALLPAYAEPVSEDPDDRH